MDNISQNLVDYFFICGLDPNIGLDPYEVTNEFDEPDSLHGLVPLKRPYKPCILQKFPDHCGSYPFPEDYSITSLCMPDGIHLFTDSINTTPTNPINNNPINHNFIVIREDASRIYGTALLFTEEVENEEIKLAVTYLQKMYLVDQNLSSKSDEFNSTNSGRDSGHFSSSGSGEFWMEDDKLFTMKAIGILSQHAYVHCFQSWLYDLWLYVTKYNQITLKSLTTNPETTISVDQELEYSSDIDLDPADIKIEIKKSTSNDNNVMEINLESYVYNILFETDPPTQGNVVTIEGPHMMHFCRCPDANDLPVFELPMRGLLEILGIENLIRVYSCVLLEYRVVIVSKDYRLLMLVADCITCLLFPFVWSHVYAPILPLAARHFLNAPLPFIMGIRIGSGESEEDVVQLASEASVCYVNIDIHKVTTPDDIPTFPYEMELRREITDLLVHCVNDKSGLHNLNSSSTNKNPRKTSFNIVHSSASSTTKQDGNEKKSNRSNTRINLTKDRENNFDDLSEIRKSYDNERRPSQSIGVKKYENKPIWIYNRLIKDAGISLFDNIEPTVTMTSVRDKSDYICKTYVSTLKFNTVLRELFLNHFLHIFYDYEQYIIPPKENSNMSSYFMDRESAVQNFDKASFLSEQPETHILFLSTFLETQMFANFIDMKMLAIWQDPHPNLIIFERKLSQMKHNIRKEELLRAKNNEMIGVRPYRGYLKSTSILQEAEKYYLQCYQQMHLTNASIKPHILSCNNPVDKIQCSPLRHRRFCASHHHHHNVHSNSDSNTHSLISTNDKSDCFFSSSITYFPILQADCLRNRPRKRSITKPIQHQTMSLGRVHQSETLTDSTHRQLNVRVQALQKTRIHLKNQDSAVDEFYGHSLESQDEEFINQKENRARIDPKPYLPNMRPKDMAQNNWNFVNTLLQETKAKTKRMVLEKMGGQEASELGHGDIFVSDVEENTLVSGLCDLLERIWCHNIDYKQGKSALWTHLMKYYERDQNKSIIKRTNKEMLRRSSITDNNQSRNELVKDALTGVGIDSYRLFRFFNDGKGEIVHQGEYFGSLKKLNISNTSANTSTPEFLAKTMGMSHPIRNNDSNSSGGTNSSGGGVSDLFFNWNQGLMGSLGRRSNVNRRPPIEGSSTPSSQRNDRNIDLISIFGPSRLSLIADIRAVQQMTDIRTDVGLSRAFVRLALEKKLLSEHLKKLLSDTNLLKELYKRHAFLRSEEEREQFLFHLLALQAVEYYSFTNLYIRSQLAYRVYIYTAGKYSKGHSTTANAWFCINGQHCSTNQRALPKDVFQFEFENQNLGILTTMRIWHDNSGMSPKWFIKYILVQNVITGQVYKFLCNRWLGKNIDDGSTERLLVGELLRINEDEMKDGDFKSSKTSVIGVQTPPRSRSPSIGRRMSDEKQTTEVAAIQEQLGNAVNNLVKYFCRLQDRDRMSGPNMNISANSGGGSCNVTLLLCGEYGLVNSMEKVFLYGFRSSRIFQKKFFVWDYLEKAASELWSDMNTADNSEESLSNSVAKLSCSDERKIQFSGTKAISIRKLCQLVDRIKNFSDSVGKDGKFQKFVCIGIRDHMFPEWIEIFGLIDSTQQYYDEHSFFREPQLREFLVKILHSLDEFTITLEPALIDGL